jgi:hypothetical protein
MLAQHAANEQLHAGRQAPPAPLLSLNAGRLTPHAPAVSGPASMPRAAGQNAAASQMLVQVEERAGEAGSSVQRKASLPRVTEQSEPQKIKTRLSLDRQTRMRQ